MVNLNGHETGNGGYRQSNTYGNSTFLDPTIKIIRFADAPNQSIVRLTKLTFLDNEVTDNGPHDKANPFVMRGGKVAGLLREKMVELLKD